MSFFLYKKGSWAIGVNFIIFLNLHVQQDKSKKLPNKYKISLVR